MSIKELLKRLKRGEKWKPAHNPSPVGCYDCGLEYGGLSWIEAVVPDKIWNHIKPEGCGDLCGILCITCISRRLNERGLTDVPVWLCGTEPLTAFPGDPGPGWIRLLRQYDGEDHWSHYGFYREEL